jgi:hypothetical protein
MPLMFPRVLLGGLLALLIALAGTASAGAQAPAPFFSVSVGNLFNADGSLKAGGDAQLAKLQSTGLNAARMDASRAAVEPFPGMRDFSVLDRIATALAAHGIRWLPTLGYAPLWDRTIAGTDKTPPSSDAAFASYAAAVVSRYGANGSFWAAHPELPALPIQSVEVWNEPNLSAYWRSGPDAARYAGLFVATRDAVHAVDASVQVVTGGLSPYADPAAFLRGMLAAQPSLKTSLDAVGFHPYAAGAPGVMEQVVLLRAAMRQLGLSSTGIVVTEVGWPLPNQSPDRAFGVPDEVRGNAVALAAKALSGGNCDVDGMTLFTWTSAMANPAEQEDWFGIARPDTSLTAAAVRYAQVVAAPPAANSLPTCGKARAPLRLSLKVTTRHKGRRSCATARVTYAGIPVNDVPVGFLGRKSTRHPRTEDDGRVTSCPSRVSRVTVRAAAGRWATSRTVRVKLPD